MSNKINAAKRLVAALESNDDFALWLMDHPNTERAMERLTADVDSVETVGDNGRDDGLLTQLAE